MPGVLANLLGGRRDGIVVGDVEEQRAGADRPGGLIATARVTGPRYTVCPARVRRRAVCSPRPLLAPVMSVVVMSGSLAARRPAGQATAVPGNAGTRTAWSGRPILGP